MPRTIIHTDTAPEPIGSYSQAVVSGNTVYISGQVPLVPGTMQLVNGGFRQQVIQVFKNLSGIADAAGGTLNEVSKITIYLLELENFATVNEVMANFFSNPYPARAVVGVASLPAGAAIEIEAILTLASGI